MAVHEPRDPVTFVHAGTFGGLEPSRPVMFVVLPLPIIHVAVDPFSAARTAERPACKRTDVPTSVWARQLAVPVVGAVRPLARVLLARGPGLGARAVQLARPELPGVARPIFPDVGAKARWFALVPLSLVVVAVGKGELDDFGFDSGFGGGSVGEWDGGRGGGGGGGRGRGSYDWASVLASLRFGSGGGGDGTDLVTDNSLFQLWCASSIPVSRPVPAMAYLFERPARL